MPELPEVETIARGLAGLGRICATGMAVIVCTTLLFVPAWWSRCSGLVRSQPAACQKPSRWYRAEIWRLGLFLTRETYQGRNGYSLRMEGLEPGINDAALERAIVMHGAPYVDPQAAAKQGRLGRSFGCPAVREAVARGVIDVLKDGQFVFAYYPDAKWLDTARWTCAG